MKTKKNMYLMAVAILVSFIIVTGWTVFANNGATNAPGNEYEKSIVRGSGLEWSPVGTWIVNVPTQMGNITLFHIVHAQDMTGKRYGGMIWQVNKNPTNFGMFPDVEDIGAWATQTVRTGPDSFETTMIMYGIKKGEGPIAETVTIGIAHSKWTLTSPNTNNGEATLATYMAAQDADGDGFPDEGEEPAVCMEYTFTCKRLTMMPDCVPTPLPE